MYQEIDPKKSVNEREKEILEFWERKKIFKKSLKNREGAERYAFYDGPPFATGTPHYGHLVASAMKDAVPRYWTMRGKYVERRWGWDCHGLPIENIVEKEMGSKSKKDIEAVGIEEFNRRCRANVLGYVDAWRRVISRFGRWADMDDAYRTMDPEYMESVWAVFADLWKKGLVYEGYRSMHICPRCETTLSQSEVAEGYKDIKDLSVVVKFQLQDIRKSEFHGEEISNFQFPISNDGSESPVYILAWTTTPWTLPGNVALAVGKEMDYIKVTVEKIDGEISRINIREGDSYIFADEGDADLRIFGDKLHYDPEYLGGDYKRADMWIPERDDKKVHILFKDIELIKSKDLIGLSYKPLFDVSKFSEDSDTQKNGWKIYGADFVTTEDGTGVVHIAPAFGTDDMNLGREKKLPFVQHIGTDGIFKPETGDLAGLDVKPRAKDKLDEVREADIAMLKKLKEMNAYFSHEKYVHSYPHCWRCDTALLNYATSSWFVAVEKIKARAMETAQNIRWVPEHMKEGRFGKWLEGARDWSISRQRFWASVMPVWKCKTCHEPRVVGNVLELATELGGVNRLYFVRHGESVNNVQKILDSKGNKQNHLTETGLKEAESTARELGNKKIDIIFTSPLARTKETAEILKGMSDISIVEDERLRETGFGLFDGKSVREFRLAYPTLVHQRGQHPEDEVESIEAIRKRLEDFFSDIHANFSGKNIAVVSHADTIMVAHALLKQLSDEEMERGWYPKHAEMRSVFSKPVDLHRPHIDDVTLRCACGGEMTRVPDVLDTWFDSGSMPYAQMHAPFENERKFATSFPADFIAEGVDQTRAWFYYLHILATATRDSHAFKNVIVNGIVQAEDGKKMSKKLKNYPDPSIVMEKYGADALRLYLLGSPVVIAENVNFSEKELGELSRGLFRMLRNTYAFFAMYANVDGWESPIVKNQKSKIKSQNLLDRWIVSELQVLIANVNDAMEKYELARAVRYFAPFVDDLSNWYVRRSRRRFWKSESDGDKQSAYETLYSVLLTLSKLLAPFAPFIADEIYKNLSLCHSREGGNPEITESVHLCDFPQLNEEKVDKDLNEKMGNVRELIVQGLSIRASSKVKVRQPLRNAFVFSDFECKEFEDVLKEELNIKEIEYFQSREEFVERIIQENLKDDAYRISPIYFEDENSLKERDFTKANFRHVAIALNTVFDTDLKLEGQAREIVRAVQEMRKSAGYNVDDRIVLGYDGMEEVFKNFGEDIIAKETLATLQKGKVENADAEQEVRIDGEKGILSVKRYTI